MTTVIVQSDSLSTWIGLAGVALGALLSTGGSWIQRRWTESSNRQREFHDAADDLRASTQNLILTLETSDRFDDKQTALTFWMPKVMVQLERLDRAVEIIAQHSKPELTALAETVAHEVAAYSSSAPTKRDASKVRTAVAEFVAEVRKTKAG